MKARIQIKSAVIAFAVLSASFAVPAHAIAVFGADVTASLRMTDISDGNGTEIITYQTDTIFGSATAGQAFAQATSTSLAFGHSTATLTDTAAFVGFTPTGGKFAIARAISTGLVFIKNTTTSDLTASFILDFGFSGFASFDPFSGEFALSRIVIRLLGPDEFGTPATEYLIDPIFADTSILNPFAGSGSVRFDVFVPSLAFRSLLLQIDAFGQAQITEVTEPGTLVLFSMGLLALIGLRTAFVHEEAVLALNLSGHSKAGFM